MATTGRAERGSQRWLQVAVNRCPEVINEAIAKKTGLGDGERIEWKSPLERDNFTEYQDSEFLERLDIENLDVPLRDFWPARGPVWDGLALTTGGRSLLIEAKANIPEFDSSPSSASAKSLHRIRASLECTQAFLGVRATTDWAHCFYQYANRLAHLYFLRELNKRDAALVFVYFVGDKTVPGKSPVSREGWQGAIDLALSHLGVRTTSPWIRDNVHDVFIDVKELAHVAWP